MERSTSWQGILDAYRRERQNSRTDPHRDIAVARQVLLDVMTTREKAEAWFEAYFTTVHRSFPDQERERQTAEKPTYNFQDTSLESLASGDPLAESPLLSSLVDSALQWKPDLLALRDGVRKAHEANMAHPNWPRIED